MGAIAGRGLYGGRQSVLGPEVETPSRTEARLREALRSAEIVLMESPYAWRLVANFPSQVSDEAVALARDEDGWSQLVPAPGARSASGWALIRFRFVAGAAIDGFTDWLAAHLRRRVTPRLMIASGLSQRTGGLYLYWGVPLALREQVMREIDILSSQPATGIRSVGLL